MKKAAALPILVAVMLLCVALIAEAQQPNTEKEFLKDQRWR